MKTLWLTTELLHPLNKGGRIRTYNILRALRELQQVTYLGFENKASAADAMSRASEYCDEVVAVRHEEAAPGSPAFYGGLARNLPSHLPYSVSKLLSPKLEKACRSALAQGNFECLVVDFVHSWVNLPPTPGVPVVIFQHNVEHQIWERRAAAARSRIARSYLQAQARRMFKFERTACRGADMVIAVSKPDEMLMRSKFEIGHCHATETGVDMEYFRRPPEQKCAFNNIVFVGSMDWMPNADGIVWFAQEVLPMIWARMPNATLSVVGRNPPAKVMNLARLDRRISVLGKVADVRPHLHTAAVSVVPLHVGGGTRIKIYESIAAGTPVVSTTIGAEGLPLKDGTHIVIADEARTFAEAVAAMLLDPARKEEISRAGLDHVGRNFGWKSVARDFQALCMQAVERSRENAGGSWPRSISA